MRMNNEARPANVHTFDIEGQVVRCIETEDGKRTWLCECTDFQERAARHPEGFCAHTAVVIMRYVEASASANPAAGYA